LPYRRKENVRPPTVSGDWGTEEEEEEADLLGVMYHPTRSSHHHHHHHPVGVMLWKRWLYIIVGLFMGKYWFRWWWW